MTTKKPPEEYVVGPESDFPPGSQKLVRVRNLEVGVFNVAGKLYALHNMCPHQFGPACKGPVGGAMICNAKTGWKFEWIRSGEILTCPWHGLEFDIITGQCFAPKTMRLRQFLVRVVDGEVRVRTTNPAHATAACCPALVHADS